MPYILDWSYSNEEESKFKDLTSKVRAVETDLIQPI